MLKKKMTAFAVSTLLLTLSLSGCGSTSKLPEQTPSCPPPPAPAAWAMEPASNSLTELDNLFGISGAE